MFKLARQSKCKFCPFKGKMFKLFSKRDWKIKTIPLLCISDEEEMQEIVLERIAMQIVQTVETSTWISLAGEW